MAGAFWGVNTMGAPGHDGWRSTIPLRRWLTLLMRPGLGIKRWAGLAVIGMGSLALGVAFAISVSVSSRALEVGRALTLANVIPDIWRGVIFAGIGGVLFGYAIFHLYRVVLFGVFYKPGTTGIIENLSTHRIRRGGPRLVAIGGGTGLATLLQGLKQYTEEITAIVTVADDGGSSGRLRTQLGISPPGDARQCLIALSESEPLMEELISYRFDSEGELQGHNMGNLLLAALTHIQRSFPDALQATARLLAVKGQVIPATMSSDVVLLAETASKRVVSGETAIGHAGEPLLRIWVEPRTCEVNPAAVVAILEADAVIIGPGSLYTSIIPNFLVSGIRRAVQESPAQKLFVCNVATQHGETDGFSAAGHLEAFEHHAQVAVTHFLCNKSALELPLESQQEPVAPQHPRGFVGDVVIGDWVDPLMPTRHDPDKLAQTVMRVMRRAPIIQRGYKLSHSR